ncbi:MAG: DUF1572 family protein [Saprospirales bacterium]|nr:DUF1572 family protein [Saprospirales bacterium]
MEDYPTKFRDALIEEAHRRLITESIPRLRHCLAQLSEEEIWMRPSSQSNSVGNMVLHLCGNARQWIGSGLGKQPDMRNRQAEFEEKGPVARENLLKLIQETEVLIQTTLERVSPGDLLEKRPVQTFEESGLSILVHVVEHFSYHVGQVSFFTKAQKDIDLGYYSGMEL